MPGFPPNSPENGDDPDDDDPDEDDPDDGPDEDGPDEDGPDEGPFDGPDDCASPAPVVNISSAAPPSSRT